MCFLLRLFLAFVRPSFFPLLLSRCELVWFAHLVHGYKRPSNAKERERPGRMSAGRGGGGGRRGGGSGAGSGGGRGVGRGGRTLGFRSSQGSAAHDLANEFELLEEISSDCDLTVDDALTDIDRLCERGALDAFGGKGGGGGRELFTRMEQVRKKQLAVFTQQFETELYFGWYDRNIPRSRKIYLVAHWAVSAHSITCLLPG